MRRHVGIVGCSPPGAALCYELICSETSALARTSGMQIEVSLHAHALSDYMRCIDAGDWAGVAQLMLSSAKRLAAAGADFAIAPCNTIHQAFDLVAVQSPLPWLHIAREVATEAKRRGFRRVALLGTSLTMQGDIYPSYLERCGIEYQIPTSNDCRQLDQYIFGEMVRGKFTAKARRYVSELLAGMREQGCDAAGLCCTELPILLARAELALPVLDSTRILATAAIEALSDTLPLTRAARLLTTS